MFLVVVPKRRGEAVSTSRTVSAAIYAGFGDNIKNNDRFTQLI